jgi:Bacterial membrane protein YfhO
MVRARRFSWIDRFMFLLLGFYVIATLGPALLGLVTLLDVNLLTRFQPFQALHGLNIATTNICRGDTVDAVMPGIEEIRSRLLAGDFPAWSSSEVGGAPLAGVPNFGQFNPLAIPYYLLPLWLAPAFVKLAEFGVAIGGMVAYLRRLRLSTASGVLAGIIFASSGFMLSWTNWPQTRVAAFIPALFWATERLVQRQRALDALPLAAVVVSMLLGGFPAVTGMALYCAALYFLARIVMVHRLRWKTSLMATLLAGLGLALGAGLSAFQLLPFAKQLSTINLGYRAQSSSNHSGFSSLLTTMVPDAQGLCINGASSSPANPIENVAFIGVAAIVLALVAITLRASGSRRSQRGVVGFLAVAVTVVVVLGWMGGPLLSFAQHFPVFSNNSIGRIRSVLGFLVAVLAGFGFERLLSLARDRDNDPPHPVSRSAEKPDEPAAVVDGPVSGHSRFGFVGLRLSWSVALLVVVTFFALFVLKDAISEAIARHAIRHLAHQVALPAILLVICVVLVVAARFGSRWGRYVALVAIPLIAVGQSASAFRASIPGSDPANFYPVTSTHRFLQQNLGFDRFAASGSMMYPATSKYYGLRTPTGHEFTVDAWKAILLAVDPTSEISPSFSNFSDKVVNASTVGHIPLLDQMAVRYFVAPDFDIVGKQAPPSATSGTVLLAADQVFQCPLAAGPLRAVTVDFASPLVGSPGAGASVHIRIHSPRGDITGARSLGQGLAGPAPVSVGVPGEDLPVLAATSAEVWVTGVRGRFTVSGNAGVPECGTVAPEADGLKLVASGAGAIVYQRLTSLPRFRWASNSRVQTQAKARVAELKSGIGPTSVLLDIPAPASENKPATVSVTAGDGDRLAADVDATGAGYLVVADSMQQPGWTATIDGNRTALVPANNAMVAVRVPAGLHKIEMTYTVPGQRSGLLISGASLLAFGAILSSWWYRRRAQQRKSRDPIPKSSRTP